MVMIPASRKTPSQALQPEGAVLWDAVNRACSCSTSVPFLGDSGRMTPVYLTMIVSPGCNRIFP
jgi:hypothetical protein